MWFVLLLVVRASISESTALGAAIVAGMAEGVKVWDTLSTPKLMFDTFYPSISQDGMSNSVIKIN